MEHSEKKAWKAHRVFVRRLGRLRGPAIMAPVLKGGDSSMRNHGVAPLAASGKSSTIGEEHGGV
jgi:hypothetical protein